MDILLLPTGDWHIGGITALHPNVKQDKNGKYKPLSEFGGWHYKNNPNYHLTSLQVRIWHHFEKCLDDVSAKRKGKRLFFLGMGDAVEGATHHGNDEHITAHEHEEANTHIELMKYVKKRLNWQRGDVLAYLQGTHVHTGVVENEIGKQLGAFEYDTETYATPHLSTELNGVFIWAYHKGVSAGQGQTRGNTMINKLRQVYYQCLQDNTKIPDMLISAHTHDAHHASWTRPDGKTMHYIITAPFQDKTRFTYDNLATNKNKVGMQTVTITERGEIVVHAPMLLASSLGHSI